MVQVVYDKAWNPGNGFATVTLPSSKSMAARKLILDYIKGVGKDYSVETNCEDTVQLQNAIRKLGEKIPDLKDYLIRWSETQKNGGWSDKVIFENGFDLGDGGTSLRFFIALVASIPGFEGEVRCGEQLKSRPIKPLIDVMQSLGADIQYIEKEGYAPIYIKGRKLHGGELVIDNSISSQFVSALLLVQSLWDGESDIIPSSGNSLPYIEMTKRMVAAEATEIEPDWSAAAFIYEIALLKKGDGGDIKINRLCNPQKSVQGDSRCAQIFENLGVVTEFCQDGSVILSVDRGVVDALVRSKATVELEMEDVPDLVPAVAVALSLSEIRFNIKGVGNLKYKESNRLESLKTELEKVGVSVEVSPDSIAWRGKRYPTGENEVVESWGDHRIAMAFAPVAIKRGYISIKGEECVSKSFPDYFDQLKNLGFDVHAIKTK